ncbi:GroES-like protein [Polyporus arcularius HHB13444]|uniref:GroES-like protein n=1 Tax=Polyporus arcularius HHB13444 TaxID=1314778 RepID=A0A5C3P2F6_9APHY|nr:GroES-like protein [Polyporus arcularius HHB13444]
MPSQHEALVTTAPYTEPELQDVPTPQPAAGQILVKNLVAGIMPADWKVPAWGMWDDSYPMVLGFDGAGVVEEVGPDVTGFTEGDRVIFQGWRDEPGRAFNGSFQQLSFEEGVTIFSPMSTVAFSLYSHKPGTESLRMSPPWEDGRGKYAGKSIFISGGATQVGQFGTIVEEVKAIAGDLVDLSYDTVVEDDTIALATAAVKPRAQLVVSIHGKEELVTKLTKPKGIQWIIGRGLQSTEQNKGALSGLLPKLPGLIEEGVIKVRENPPQLDLVGAV